MKFLVDNQLPAALAHFLRQRGLDCRHATEQGRIIITKDEDFLYLASQPNSQVRLIWIRLGNCRTKALLAALEGIWPKLEASLKAGDRIVELR